MNLRQLQRNIRARMTILKLESGEYQLWLSGIFMLDYTTTSKRDINRYAKLLSEHLVNFLK
jgi:hypothetical protein